jgi:MFS family permease
MASLSTLDSAAPSRKLFSVGTLQYTRGQLARVFVWLLLGDFCLHLMDNGVVPTLVPLQFEAMGASKTLYNFVALTLVNFLYVILVPIVSTWSDRTRTRIGRRRPFLLVTAPLLAIVLVLLGFTTNIARFFDTLAPGLVGSLGGVMPVAIGLTVLLFVAFKLLDMFPQSVYYYLWPDVIPAEFLGMFGALFRVFYAGGSLVFNWYLIGLAKEHPEEIYMLSAALYLAAFLLLVWRVKEPAYPPPPKIAQDGASGLTKVGALVKGYFVDCFSHSFYWKFFIAMAVFQMAYQPFIANIVFYGKEVYGDTPEGLANYGATMGWKDIGWIVIYLALVPLMRFIHPVIAGMVGYVLMTATAIFCAIYVHDAQTFRIGTIALFVSVGFYLGATAAIGPRLLPREKYGQFASAGAIVFRLSIVLVGTLAGFAFQTLGSRFVYWWLVIFLSIGTLMMLLLLLHWVKLGGLKGYEPPRSWPDEPSAAGGPQGFPVVAVRSEGTTETPARERTRDKPT